MLELKNISLSVEDEFTNNAQKEILRDISLTVETGKFIVITGPNGGGKSTMAKMIAGILQPDHGQILLDGEDITGLNITERAQKGISFAFQQPVRFKGLTVMDLLELAGAKLDPACMLGTVGYARPAELVMVNGRVVVEHGRVLGMDEEQTRVRAQQLVDGMLQKAE